MAAYHYQDFLYLHRSYFVQALRAAAPPNNPLLHEFAPSVLAACRSACRLTFVTKGLYHHHPGVTSRRWHFWSSQFSACIVLGTLVVESPSCPVAEEALQEMEDAVRIFEQGSRLCRPSWTMTLLQMLMAQAQDSFRSNTPHLAFPGGASRSSDLSDSAILSSRESIVISQASAHSEILAQPSASTSQSMDQLDYISAEGSVYPTPSAIADSDISAWSYFTLDGSLSKHTSLIHEVQGMPAHPPFSEALSLSPEHHFLDLIPNERSETAAERDTHDQAQQNRDDTWKTYMGQLMQSSLEWQTSVL